MESKVEREVPTLLFHLIGMNMIHSFDNGLFFIAIPTYLTYVVMAQQWSIGKLSFASFIHK